MRCFIAWKMSAGQPAGTLSGLAATAALVSAARGDCGTDGGRACGGASGWLGRAGGEIGRAAGGVEGGALKAARAGMCGLVGVGGFETAGGFVSAEICGLLGTGGLAGSTGFGLVGKAF
mmetsp:Transcript_23488/g.29959  ORF Transcript_23488/g.29959 Transcript_23488/m.29959 type:complete len:119 (-) Transcript_23488:1071-1427(-)